MGRQSIKTKAERRGSSPAQMIEQRASAVDQMNKSLRRKFTQIEKQVNDLRAENLRYYYKIGMICKGINEDPERYLGHDGTPGLRLIEQALSTQARTLRKAAAFAEMYSEDMLEELIALSNPDTGFQLHWGHVSYLLTLATAEQRQRYANEATEKMWDPGTLHATIRKRQRRGSGHGRPHAVPKTVAAQVRQMLTVSQQWQRKNDTVWSGEGDNENTNNVFTNVLNTPPDALDHDLLDDLEEVRTLMFLMSEATTDNVGLLDRVIEHVSGVLTHREEDAATQAEHGREQRQIDLDTGSSRSRRRGRATAGAPT